MAEDRDDLLALYLRTAQEVDDAVAGLTDEQLTDPSLDGWSVKDHLAHLALWHAIRADEVTRISAGYDSAWRMTHEQDDAFNQMSHELRVGLPLEQVRWELDTARQRLIDAIANATPEGLDASRYGEAGLRSLHESEHAGWIRRWREQRGI
jgi:hypothetical protein